MAKTNQVEFDAAVSASTSAPPAPTPAPQGSMWAFTYDGPIAKIDDRKCSLCNAISSGCGKDAMQHGSDSRSCPSCEAARTKRCPLHCGISEALSAATAPTDLIGIANGIKSAIAGAPAAKADCSQISVKTHVFCGMPDLPPGVISLQLTFNK